MAEEVRAPIRILIVDDHAIVRAGLRMLIESHVGLQVVGQAATCRDALAIAAQEQPDIILLDLDLAGESGLALLPELPCVAPRARVIILTGGHNATVHQQAVHGGAMGVVLKDQAAEVLHKAILQVQAGGVWIDAALTARLLSGMTSRSGTPAPDPSAAKIATLTLREREVIALIAEGLTNKQIAQRLSISAATVNHHLSAVYGKLDVPSRLELAIYAYGHGLTKASP
jgi:DNA-binding NarL/FixJ family response regulator